MASAHVDSQPLRAAALGGLKRSRDMFYQTDKLSLAALSETSRARVACKAIAEYRQVSIPRPPPGALATAVSAPSTGPLLLLTDASTVGKASSAPPAAAPVVTTAGATTSSAIVLAGAAAAVQDVADAITRRAQPRGVAEDSLPAFQRAEELAAKAQASSRAIVARRTAAPVPEPRWHAPWTLMRVISGHLGWVRCVAVEPGNEWFVTGAADRTIKFWDLASGTLKLTLTGHVNTVRALAVSDRHPYLYSAGEDKAVKCWDLEANKVIRSYHGHLSGVYSLALHPTLDLLFTGGRDSVCRVWDARTKSAVYTLSGHENAVSSILANSVDPQVITGSMDSTIRLWDLAAGKPRTVLTHHKKSVRALAQHAKQFAFISGSADHLKKWALPDGDFVHNYTGHSSIINCLALNADDVLVSGGDDGTLKFWDYETGYAFQEVAVQVQPGSLDSEAGVYAATFDASGSRLITCEADKTIKIWREDTSATPESHPVDMKAWTDHVRKHKRY